jgi:hypothetical protein
VLSEAGKNGAHCGISVLDVSACETDLAD